MNKWILKFISFLVVFTPFLEPYRISSITLDTLSLFLVIVLSIFFVKNKQGDDYGLKVFLIYALSVPNIIAIAYGYTSHLTSSLIVLGLYAICYYKVFPNVSLEYVKKYYRIFAWLVCIVFILQEYMYISLGYRFSALMPFLDVRYDGITMSSFISSQMFYPRSSTFFLEPSHQAHFLLPYLAMVLGDNSSGLSIKRYIEPIIVSIVLFFLQSGCGVVGTAFIWLFYVLGINLSKWKKTVFIICSSLVAVYIIGYITSTEIGNSLISRTSELEVGGDYERSGTIRIFRGFYVFGAMDYLQQLFGVGTGGSVDVIEHSPFFAMFFGTERYLNNIQMLLVGFGVFGSILFFRHFIRLYKNNLLSGKLALIAFLSLCFLESFFMTSKMILFFIIAYSYKKKFEINT